MAWPRRGFSVGGRARCAANRAAPGSDTNPVGVREHFNSACQGLRHISGLNPYPLVDSFYPRGCGVGVRHAAPQPFARSPTPPATPHRRLRPDDARATPASTPQSHTANHRRAHYSDRRATRAQGQLTTPSEVRRCRNVRSRVWRGRGAMFTDFSSPGAQVGGSTSLAKT